MNMNKDEYVRIYDAAIGRLYQPLGLIVQPGVFHYFAPTREEGTTVIDPYVDEQFKLFYTDTE